MRRRPEASSQADVRARTSAIGLVVLPHVDVSIEVNRENIMQQSHPVYGDLVEKDERIERGRWMIRNANVQLDAVLDLLDAGWTTEDILKRHMLILRSDLVEITMLHGLADRRDAG